MRIEDLNSIYEALKAGTVNKIYIKAGLRSSRIREIEDEARKRRIPIAYISGKKFRVAADVSPVRYSEFDDVIQRCLTNNSFILILDSIEDPNNLGAVMRSAEFFGCSGVVIPKRRAAQPSETVARVSGGAIYHINIARVDNLATSLKKVKKFGISVVGADLGGEEMKRVNLSPPIAIVVGGEDRGISNPVKKQCDVLVKIPGYGKIGSLNLSVAAAIVMYEFSRRIEDER